AIALLAYVLSDEVITLDELFAIAGIYVLLGLLWASAYAIVIHYDPGAIFINPTNDPDGIVGFGDLVYYSLTTLTSTGYGEITPVSPAARALAMLQQIVGVLFVAILISRLTNLYRAPKA
ncbi:MAG TPA: potassium channel family protein, partial [Patescibacteria group bacterium]|nr:potassium channel family protein [Patescibacteria group bacterium]